ncbi:MAG: acyltransferase [Chitinophagaceae bacterium]|nr:acyltransferase [Chitinophagaceae bacterium]
MQLTMSTFISQKFKFWSFVSMLLLVFVHGYNLQQRYLQPFTTVEEPLTFNTYLQYFFANGILRFRIPMLFLISGYLYALHDVKPYGQRTLKRLRTLGLPYLIWSAIALLFTYLLEMYQPTKALVESSRLMQIDDTRLFLHDYKWFEWLGRWILVPVPYQLWFIRVLLLYNIAYPVIKWLVTHKIAKWIFFPIVFLLWLSDSGFFFIEGEGLLFFSLGVWMRQTNFNIETPKKWMNPIFWLIVFIVTTSVKTWLAFKGFTLIHESVYTVLLLLHKLVVFAGLISAWFGCDALVKWCMQKQWFVWCTAFAFIIYALHVPLVTYTIDGMFKCLQIFQYYRLITFFLLPLLIIVCSMGIGFLLRKYLPKTYSVITGRRGF